MPKIEVVSYDNFVVNMRFRNIKTFINSFTQFCNIFLRLSYVLLYVDVQTLLYGLLYHLNPTFELYFQIMNYEINYASYLQKHIEV